MDRGWRRRFVYGLTVACLLPWLPHAWGQDANLAWPMATIEQKLASGEFEILSAKGSRWAKDRTQRVKLRHGDGSEINRAKERLTELDRELEEAYARWQDLESRRDP